MPTKLNIQAISSAVEEISSTPPVNPKTSYRNIFLATVAAQFFGIGLGMLGSYSSPACADMKKPGSRLIHITEEEISWIASLPMLSGMFGNALSGYACQKFGRKATLMFLSVPFTLSWLMIAYAPSVPVIIAARIIGGTCTGMCTVAVPTYVVEISAIKIRGLLAATFPMAVAMGMLTMMSFGIILRWSWLAIAGAVVVASGASLLCFMPESPPWLIKKGRRLEAIAEIQFLKGKRHDAMKELKDTVQDSKDEAKVTLSELLNPSLYKPLLISLILTFVMSFAGFPVVMTYSVTMLENAGISMDPNVAATIVTLVQVVATIVSSLLMDRAGRRILYITSGSIVTFSLIILGTHSFCLNKYGAIAMGQWTWVPIFCLIVYLASFSLGFGAIPFVVVPELVPISSRSFVMAASSVNGSLFGFIVIKTFNNMQSAIGTHGTYWTYSMISLSGAIFYYFFVPETKGRTINDINNSFS